MRNLRQRLAQFDRAAKATSRPSAEGPLPLQAVLEQGAQWVGESPSGFLRREVALELEPHLADRTAAFPAEAWRRMGVEAPTGPGAWTVLDTETTGLEGGAGTLVFLVGLVHWEDRGARLVQLLMPEPAGEAAFLQAMQEELAASEILLSYNGRSFDVPRLRARLRLQKLDDACLDRPHLDLLHPTRPLARTWLDDCRLVSIERELLGLTRDDDLPGSEAPEVYRTLLADRRDTGLDRVVEHNAQDVKSLIDLAHWLAEVHLESAALSLPALARVALARSLRRRGAEAAASRCLARAIESEEKSERAAARWELASLHRRHARWEEAKLELCALLEETPSSLPAHVELAKLYEHRLKELEAARDIVLQAIRMTQNRRALGTASDFDRRQGQELSHRLRRLQRKLSRRAHG